ncbi:hypothetical protein Cch01nite_14930 [Cellulomonas chitinilytica]|uniref:Lysine transporter LysE n=1 Tax=Cellulomonas chitinilytica TaxID=398759 RepID=A0A919U246_9CELL|nr:LysE family translocator [Cellulomonas chitinilytica]GIG20769.1 hypothetical protein Cch01nite_14930 [Cellulomonas chitinilytica]
MFVPQPDVLLAFVLAALALNVTPGADMVFVLGTSLQHRTRAGVLAAVGIAVGSLCHATLAAAGLSALVAASRPAMAVVTAAGAAYLVWVGVRMVRDRSTLVVPADDRAVVTAGPAHAPPEEPAPPRALQLVGRGATVNLLNVKVILFFLSFIPLFVRPDDGPVWQQVLLFGLLFDVLGTLVLVGVAVAAGRASRALLDRPGVVVGVRRTCGAVLVVLAVVLVATRLLP